MNIGLQSGVRRTQEIEESLQKSLSRPTVPLRFVVAYQFQRSASVAERDSSM